MNTEKIFDENGRGFTRVFSTDKVELVNPVKYYKTFELEKRAISLRDLLYAKYPFLTSQLDDNFFVKKVEEMLVGFFEKFEQTKVHDNFIQLLKTTQKKNQEALLKGMTLNPDELMSLIFKSYNDFGFYTANIFLKIYLMDWKAKNYPNFFILKKMEQFTN
ncbi:hypothetical protein [Riemerella anatipestifer]|uniref:Uncharacterized protein n=1 Tax=Riemerella anatipestifer TaxID=34085 RepID=A0A1S7DVV9_RIEAN|nr:hypothetical protein [Riemerella anatipestifer]AQY23265.1 hypothetical protein AB406_2335 [Riemerella anatipestifer]MCO4304983.1 hypothetical protein [Riemerella anatipestifer]MCO7353856.1 hypothetical protein [Riemerella anatipestifer]MCQ4040363.1 hypothetical protein [Riemerella anatipestifer]MCT6761955.1 hypothetical protein [Riemerella anatipestifer]